MRYKGGKLPLVACGGEARCACCATLACVCVQGAAAGAAPAKGSLMVKEDQEEGHVSMKVYLRYIAAYGTLAFIL